MSGVFSPPAFLCTPSRTLGSKTRTTLGFSPSFQPPKAKLLPSRKLTIPGARTESEGVSLGFRAPEFELPEPLTGKSWTLEDFDSHPALLVMFICNHCPFVIHLKKAIVKLSDFYMKKGLAVVAISSNSVLTHPQDGPDFMAEDAKLFNYPFPYLYDESQDVARAFGAVCTPEFFLFKKSFKAILDAIFIWVIWKQPLCDINTEGKVAYIRPPLPYYWREPFTTLGMVGGLLSWYTTGSLMTHDLVMICV